MLFLSINLSQNSFAHFQFVCQRQPYRFRPKYFHTPILHLKNQYDLSQHSFQRRHLYIFMSPFFPLHSKHWLRRPNISTTLEVHCNRRQQTQTIIKSLTSSLRFTFLLSWNNNNRQPLFHQQHKIMYLQHRLTPRSRRQCQCVIASAQLCTSTTS